MPENRNIKLIQWFNFFLDFRPYAVVAIIYFSHITGSYALGLAVFSTVTVSSSLFEIPTGLISDRIGRKGGMIYGSIASVAALTFYALGCTFWILAVGAVFEGLSRSLFSGNNDALVYESIEDKGRFSEFLGKTSSMFQVGLGLSALAGGFIASVSLSFVMWVSVIPQVICLLISLFVIEPKRHSDAIPTNTFAHIREAAAEFWKNKKLRTLSITSALGYGIGETQYQFAPAFIALLWPTWAIGLVRSLNNLLGAMSFWFAGPLIKKMGAMKSALVGSISNRVFGIAAFAYPTIASPLLMSFGSLFYGLNAVSQSTLLQAEFTDQQRATMGSLNSLLGSLFFAIFAIVFGTFADDVGAAKALLIGEILLFSVTFLYWKLLKNEKQLLNV